LKWQKVYGKRNKLEKQHKLSLRHKPHVTGCCFSEFWTEFEETDDETNLEVNIDRTKYTNMTRNRNRQ